MLINQDVLLTQPEMNDQPTPRFHTMGRTNLHASQIQDLRMPLANVANHKLSDNDTLHLSDLVRTLGLTKRSIQSGSHKVILFQSQGVQ